MSIPPLSPPYSFSGAVLAGGLSSRMGRDKAFLELGGTTLIAVQAGRLAALGCDDLIISGRPGIDYGLSQARIVRDSRPGCGPIAGLCAVLEAARHPVVLVLAVDLPSLTVPWLRSLLQSCPPGKGIAPRHDRGFEPLAAVYPKSLLDLASKALESGELSLQKLIRRACENGFMTTLEVGAEERLQLANWNQ